MDCFTKWMMTARCWVWGPPLLLFIALTGLYLTWRLRGIQLRCFFRAIALLFQPSQEDAEGDLSHFQALMTALASAVGTGCIAGVATALTLGGPGAIFWMWCIAFLGMATSFAEATLSVRYRTRDEQGVMCGGPMYTLLRGWKAPRLALFFSAAGVLASFGTGCMVQANSVADVLTTVVGIPSWLTACVLMVMTACVLMGGVQSIGKIVGFLVPIMAICYFVAALGILVVHSAFLPAALKEILRGAFGYSSAVGGAVGATVMDAVRMGVARGVFSNESGMGTAAIAAASAKTDTPSQQGLLAMFGTFVTTMVVCTVTALVVLVTGVMETGTSGASLVVAAFDLQYRFGGELVAVGLLMFAYSTTVAWAYYGERCLTFLGKPLLRQVYPWVYTLLVFPGAWMPLAPVWAIADVLNGLMTLPNLVGLLALSGVVVEEAKRGGLMKEEMCKQGDQVVQGVVH